MATFNLVITYPDGDGPRVMTAMKGYYNVATNAEAIEAFRKDVTFLAKNIVKKQERGSVEVTFPTVNFT